MTPKERSLLRYIRDYCDLPCEDRLDIVSDLLQFHLVSPFYYDLPDDYITPAATAAFYGAPHCLQLLCNYGAVPIPQINKRKPFLDPLIAALMGGSFDCILILLRYSHQHLISNGGWKFLPDIMTELALRKGY